MSDQDQFERATFKDATPPLRSVLQDWVMRIPLRQQGVLIVAMRGPDGAAKEDTAKPLVRTLRGLVMNAGRTGKAMERGVVWKEDPFMTVAFIGNEEIWALATKRFFDNWDSYNVHFLQHLMHAYGVVGLGHPEEDFRTAAWAFYERCCKKLHVISETPDLMAFRLRDGKREEEDDKLAD